VKAAARICPPWFYTFPRDGACPKRAVDRRRARHVPDRHEKPSSAPVWASRHLVLSIFSPVRHRRSLGAHQGYRLNFYDTLIIAGKYQTKPPLPSRRRELRHVDSVGAGVTTLRRTVWLHHVRARANTRRAGREAHRLTVDLDFERAAPQHHLWDDLSRAEGPRDWRPARRWRCSAPPARRLRRWSSASRWRACHRLRVERRKTRLRARARADEVSITPPRLRMHSRVGAPTELTHLRSGRGPYSEARCGIAWEGRIWCSFAPGRLPKLRSI